MKIPSDIKHIRKASAGLENFLRSRSVDESLIFDIRLSVEEAVKNAIVHGNKNRKEIPVYINYSLENSRFSIEVEDEGNGFNPGGLPDPTREENLYKASGRGVFLIKNLMDEVRYNEKGNKVFMAKYIKR